MITIYESTATDFSTLGLGALTPSDAVVDERAGGLYEDVVTQPIDGSGRHALLACGRIIKGPAPVRETPEVEIGNTGTVTRHIYRVNTGGQRLNLHTEPNTSSRVIYAYPPGTEVAVVDNTTHSTWYQVIVLDGGATGWMYASNLAFVRDEDETISGDTPGTVIKPRQTREQLFRIVDVETDTEARTVTATAQHITYDLRGAIVAGEYKPEGVAADTVCAQLMARADHDVSAFRLICTVTAPVTADYTGRNILDCLLDPESGVVAQTGARLIRDNFDIFVLPDEARATGAALRYGKNLLRALMRTDASGIVTRIQPAGRTADGESLYITENNGFVDSAHIGDYPVVYAKRIEYDVVESRDLPIDQARAQLAAKAQADFDAGCDLPAVHLEASFVRLELTDEYRSLGSAFALHLYDAVPVIDREAGLSTSVRMTGYKYDQLLDHYRDTTLGELT